MSERLNDFTREAERFRDIDRAVMRQVGDDISDEQVGESPALASPAVCASCDNTGCDSSSGELCSQCPTGAAFRDELRQFDEPCYGACARCPRQGNVWYVTGEWLCETCKERT